VRTFIGQDEESDEQVLNGEWSLQTPLNVRNFPSRFLGISFFCSIKRLPRLASPGQLHPHQISLSLSRTHSPKMECSWPENSPSNPRKAIEELVQGHQLANQLRGLLSSWPGDDGSAPANDLVLKILNSFTNSLSILNSVAESDSDVSQIQPNARASSPCRDAPKSESSGESCRSISTVRDRRGCYKRR
jgi:hypothetical protein